jgi:hypothetical protein
MAELVLGLEVLSNERNIRLLPDFYQRRANAGHPRVERLDRAANYKHAVVFTRFDNPETIVYL